MKKAANSNVQRPLLIGFGLIGLLVILLGLVYIVVPKEYFSFSGNQNKNAALLVKPQNLSQKTWDLIQRLEEKVQEKPDSISDQQTLAAYYLQAVRETADTGYYTRIDQILEKLDQQDPKNAATITLQAAVTAGRHHFKEAIELAEKAVSIQPKTGQNYAILADAEIELGEYENALKTLQTMVDLRPDFSSYSRIAHARELHNDIPGAMEIMQEAITAGSFFPENVAWGYTELGKLTYRTDLKKARQEFEQALSSVPEYAPALKWLGRIAYAEGNKEEALSYIERAFKSLPIAEYATDLADIYEAMGESAKAEQQYTIVKLTYQDQEKNGVDVDQEYALFLLDHDLELEKALEKAQRAYTDRPNIYSASILGFAFFKNNRAAQGQKYIEESLRLKTPDSLLYFHAGLIEKALGNKEKAKSYLEEVLKINPHFSIKYPKEFVEKTLADL